MTEVRSPEKQQAIIDNVELASKVAWRFCARRSLTREFEEFKHQSMLALVIAVDAWDGGRLDIGAEISGPYLVQRINWQLIRYAHERTGIDKSHHEAIRRGEEPPVALVPLVLPATAKREREKLRVRQLVDSGAARQFGELHVRLSLGSLFRHARLSAMERVVLRDALNEVPREQTARRIGREVNHVRQDAMTRLKAVARNHPSS